MADRYVPNRLNFHTCLPLKVRFLSSESKIPIATDHLDAIRISRLSLPAMFIETLTCCFAKSLACRLSWPWRSSQPWFVGLAVLLVGLLGAAKLDAEETFDLAAGRQFIREFCVDCHRDEDAEAGLRLDDFETLDDLTGAIASWKRIAARVESNEMPPQQSHRPTLDQQVDFVDWVRQTIHQAVCDDGVSPGPARLRRLNRTEYANTLRDLLGIHVNVARTFPADGAGGEGFDNAAETLFVSPIYVEKYLEASRAALGHALKDPRSRQRILVARPGDSVSAVEAAEQVLRAFLPRAFRRPVTDQEIAPYTDIFQEVVDEGDSFVGAITAALEAVLISPKFVFLIETPHASKEPVAVSDYELASRLSYFLWASMPDEELMRLAGENKLRDEAVLRQQVRRMLRSEVDGRGLRRDAKVRAFASSFMEQWLGTRALGREFKPDPAVARGYDSELEGGMKYEPIFFMEDLLAENRSLLNLIDSDFTYVNRRLAQHYRIDGSFREQPKRVQLEDKHHRGGLLGMAGVLAVSSHPYRTSPVLRGKWILETMLGTPPPPAPPNVPELDRADDRAAPATLRERLEAHREDPNCASCHNLMDPLGFGLENYDVLGRWRTEVDGRALDTRGQLPGGDTFTGPVELKGVLMERKDQFIRQVTRKVLGYALGRGLTEEDDCVVEQIAETLAKDDYRSQTLITEVVFSVPFLYKAPDRTGGKSASRLDPTHEP